jgi:hypothetical protein
MLDSTDLVFRADPLRLWDVFEEMDPRALMALGPDLSPHYRAVLHGYLKDHPGSGLGLPGPGQGLNSGVALYRLDRMRASGEYEALLAPDRVTRLLDTFRFVPQLAEQDWLTELSWIRPELVHRLDCRWNRQVGGRGTQFNANGNTCRVRHAVENAPTQPSLQFTVLILQAM